MTSKIFSGLAALALSLAAAPALAATENLIVNGTFDNTTTGWTGSYRTRDSDPVIDTGSYFFAGAGSFHAIYQDFTLTTDHLAALAGPGLNFTLSADLVWLAQPRGPRHAVGVLPRRRGRAHRQRHADVEHAL